MVKQDTTVAETGEEWSDDDIETVLTAIFLGICTLILLGIIFVKQNNRNDLSVNTLNARTSTTTFSNNTIQQQQQQQQHAQLNQNRLNYSAVNNNESDFSFCTIDTMAYKLVDGILPFRHCPASKYKPDSSNNAHSNIEKVSELNEKLVIEILSSIFIPKRTTTDATSSATIPYRGSNIVLSLPETSFSFSSLKLKQLLWALGTTYNLFLIINTTNSSSNQSPLSQEKLLEAFQRKISHFLGIPHDVILKHRIVVCSTIVGRVAFVRQLKPDTVIDFDIEVLHQLNRFGFRVVILEEDKY